MGNISLDERLGVPDGIMEAAEKIYEGIISYIEDNYYPEDKAYYLEGDKISLLPISVGKGNSKIEMNRIKVFLNNIGVPSGEKSIIMTGYSISQRVGDRIKKGTYSIEKNPYSIQRIDLNFATKPQSSIKDFLDMFRREKDIQISSIAHEIHHEVNSVNKGDVKLSDFVHNSAHNNIVGLDLNELDIDDEIYGYVQKAADNEIIRKFLFLIYYTLRSETLVKSSELYTLLMKSGISRNEFKDWFEEQEMVKRLREASAMSYESLYQELLRDASKLKAKVGIGEEISDNIFVLTLLSLLKYVIISEYNNKVERFVFHRFSTNSLKPEERFEIPKIVWWEKHADDLDEIINEEKIKSFLKNYAIKLIKKQKVH